MTMDMNDKPPTEEANSLGNDAEFDALADEVIDAIKTVYDPEIPVNIFDLGLIYKVDVSESKDVTIEMTLTAPGCPVAGEMPGWVQAAVADVEGVGDVLVNMVFDPPWDPSLMSDEAKLELNMF